MLIKVVKILRNNTVSCRTIKQIFEAQQRLKEKNWEYKLQVNVTNVQNSFHCERNGKI